MATGVEAGAGVETREEGGAGAGAVVEAGVQVHVTIL